MERGPDPRHGEGAVAAPNWAVTVVPAAMVTAQVPVPAHPPPVHPPKVDPLAGIAVSVTPVPVGYAAEQFVPQLIPAGLELTVPLPVPVLTTERVTRFTTVRTVLPLAPFALAVIVVEPRLKAVASPVAASIVATLVSLLVHVTGPLPVTAMAVEELLVVPLPSCPAKFRPQHCTVPSASRAHVCQAPALTAAPGASPETPTGVDELLFLPSPSWP
jgi:hypothetical protein